MRLRFLHQVGADQQHVAGKQRAAQVAQKFQRALALEIADGAAEEHHQERFAGLPFGRGARHPIEIGLDERMHLGDVGQIALATRQCVGRYVDGIVAESVSTNGLEQMPCLLSDSAAQLDDCHARWKQAGDIIRMLPQQTLVRASEAIFGKMGNGLEKRAAQFVIQILGMQLLLRLREAAAHVGRKLAYDGVGVLLSFSLRRRESLRRHKGSWDGTSCGKSGAACRQP